MGGVPRNPVPVDAIPNIGENQQIVFTEWPGRSPQDIDDQISYPLTVALLGIPGVKDIRSYSIFGFSTIYVVFEDDIEFYWSRSRVLEKLNSLPAGTLPEGITPMLGPDATALGQVFWYTLEGRDSDGNPTGGWDPHELRSIQDFIVKYKLAGVEGVSEVASIGGFVREYQVDVNPDAMRAADITLKQVIAAVRKSNLDVGARTLEVNRAEYVVRGLGFIKDVADIEKTAITARDGQPILIEDIATVALGPALRRGVLTKAGEEAVGGVIVVRYGENPMATIQRVKAKIDDIASGLPSKVLADGTESRVTIVPFYDRTGLIQETLQTLNSAIEQQVLVTIIVVVLMVMHLRSSILIGAMLPITVLMTFIGMKAFGVDANIVALSGIAIAIGTIVDVGIVLSENILRRLDEAEPDEPRLEVVYRASAEVGGAVMTAIATTVVGFLPVFTMEAAEGKLFKPLAYTKTFALIASIIIALTILPAAAQAPYGASGCDAAFGPRRRRGRRFCSQESCESQIWLQFLAGLVIVAFAAFYLIKPFPPRWPCTLDPMVCQSRRSRDRADGARRRMGAVGAGAGGCGQRNLHRAGRRRAVAGVLAHSTRIPAGPRLGTASQVRCVVARHLDRRAGGDDLAWLRPDIRLAPGVDPPQRGRRLDGPCIPRSWQRVHAIARRRRVPLHADDHGSRLDR